MAALPSSGINPTLVRNAIGESMTAVHALMFSNKVNRWGFNSPSIPQQSYYWGVQPYLLNNKAELGAFRNYDHSWRCYTLEKGDISGALQFYADGTFTITVIWLSGEAPASPVYHYFDAFISRSPFTTHNAGVQIWDEREIVNHGTASFNIDPQGIGDGLGPLPENSTLYIKVVHTTSPERRFDMRQCYADGESNVPATVDKINKTVIFEVPVGADPFTHYSNVSNVTNYFVVQEPDFITATISVSHTNPYQTTIYAECGFNTASNFGGTGHSLTGNITLPAATVDGNGVVTPATGNITVTSNTVAGAFTIGSTFYGRARITSATHGTFSSNYTNFNGTVSDELPM